MLQNNKDQIVCYHEHDSLLDHKEEEALSEEDRKAAWAEYEAEKKVRQTPCLPPPTSTLLKNQRHTYSIYLPCPSFSNSMTSKVSRAKAPLLFDSLCELVLDLFNPFIT